jgi:tetratricopeptide (TPR) repeat protein
VKTPTFLAAAALATAAIAGAAPTETQIQSIGAARAEYKAARQALREHDYGAAIEALNRAARLDPDNADVQNLLGFAHRESGEVKASLPYYERALALNPNHVGAHEYIGHAYLYLGQVGKAKEHLARLGEICGDCPEHESLERAIAEWTPWRTSPRMNRGY